MKRLNATRNTIQGTIWGGIDKIVSVLFPFIIRTIIISKLGAEYAGLSSLFTSLLQMLSLADLGISTAVVYAMYRPIAENDVSTISALLNYFKKVYFIIGCIIMTIGLLLLPFLEILIKGTIPSNTNIYVLFTIYLLNTVISYWFFAYRGTILYAYQRKADDAKIHLIINCLMYIVQIIVLLIFQNYYFYIIFLPLFTLVYNLLKYLYVKKHYPQITCQGEIDISKKKEIEKNISALFLHKVGGVTVNTIDNIVISAFLGLVVLSNYNNYYYIISALTSIIMIFFNSLTAGIGNKLVLDSKEKNVSGFYSIFYINGFLVSVCTVCLFIIFQDFITIWVGKKYLFDFNMLVMLCVYFYIHTIRRTVIMYRDAAGMWDDNKWQPIISAIVNLFLNFLLIQSIGIEGVVISTIIAMVFIDIPWEINKLLNDFFKQSIFNYVRKLISYTCITFISCIIVFMILSFWELNNIYIRLFTKGCLSFVVASVIFIICTFKTKEFRNAMNLLLRTMNHK